MEHQLVRQTYIIHSYNCKDKIKIYKNTPKIHSNWSSKDPYTYSHYSLVVNNSSITSKRAHVCILTMIAASLAAKVPQVFPLIVLIGFSSIREKKKRLKPPFFYSMCDALFSLYEHYFANPNGKGVPNWNANSIFKFHEDPTIKDRFWVSIGKEKVMIWRTFLLAQIFFHDFQRWECLERSS